VSLFSARYLYASRAASRADKVRAGIAPFANLE
jgi:hypothetical protein